MKINIGYSLLMVLLLLFSCALENPENQKEVLSDNRRDHSFNASEYFQYMIDSLSQLDTVIIRNPRFQELVKKYRKAVELHPEYIEKRKQWILKSSTYNASSVFYDSCLGMSLEEFKEFQNFVDSLKSPF